MIKEFGRIKCNGHDRGPLNPKGVERVQLEALDEQAGVEAQGSIEGCGEWVCNKRTVDTLYTEVSSCDEDETEPSSPATELCPTKCGTAGEDEAPSSPRVMRGRHVAAGNVEDKILVE